MTPTEGEVRRFLPMRGGNMSSEDIALYLESGVQWVKGSAGIAAIDTRMGEVAAVLKAASFANMQLDAGSGNRANPKVKALSDAASEMLNNLSEQTRESSDDPDVSGEYFISNDNWPYTEIDALILGRNIRAEVDDPPYPSSGAYYPYLRRNPPWLY